MVDRDKVIKALRACYSADVKWCQARVKGQCDYNVAYCRMALFKDAAELLEAQEPRVMTLEEVKILDSDYYYLESIRSPGKELREIVGTYGLTCVTWPGITWARQTMGDSGYGKT